MSKRIARILCIILLALFTGAGARAAVGAENFTKSRNYSAACRPVSLEDDDAALLPLPKGKGAWLMEISRSGGMRPVTETVRLNSAGDIMVTSERFMGGKKNVECSRTERLAPRELLKIKQSVASLKPAAWKADYSDPQHPVCCDQPTTRVKLQWRGDKGAARAYEASWYPGAYELVPTDLKALATFVQSSWDAARGHCQP